MVVITSKLLRKFWSNIHLFDSQRANHLLDVMRAEEYKKGFLYFRNFDRIGEAKIARATTKFRPSIVSPICFYYLVFMKKS